MASYRNFKLYRTNPVLGGNMKMDIFVSPSLAPGEKVAAKGGTASYGGIVKGFQLSPISSLVSHSNIQQEDILVRPHEMNIKKFYDNHKEYFFKSVIDMNLASDWHYPIPESTTDAEIALTKLWDDTYWSGTQRIHTHNMYNACFEVFSPLWVESAQGFKFVINVYSGVLNVISINIKMENPESKPQKEYTFHERFCKYLISYLTNAGICDFDDRTAGNDKCVYMDLSTHRSVVYGLDASSGSFTAKEDRNILNNLVYRERFLVEADSNILQLFPANNMISPNILNFNFVLDDAFFTSFTGNTEYVVTCDAYIKRGSNYFKLDCGDIYTNHYNIPKLRTDILASNAMVTEPLNVLDHLKDWNVVDIMHYNKINQYVPTWCYSANTDTLFNIYNGFGSYYIDANGNAVVSSHTNGSSNVDIDDEGENAYKSNWTGYIKKVDSMDIHNIITTTCDPKTASTYIEDDPIFKDASGNIGSVSFNYSGRYKTMYVATCTSDNLTDDLTNHQFVNLGITNSWAQINILYTRLDDIGNGVIETLPVGGYFGEDSYESDEIYNLYHKNDELYQVYKYADATNTWGEYLNIGKATLQRNWDEVRKAANEYCLSVIFFEAYASQEDYEADFTETGAFNVAQAASGKNKSLFVIFYSPSVTKEGSVEKKYVDDYIAGALKITSISEALTTYWNTYKTAMDEARLGGSFNVTGMSTEVINFLYDALGELVEYGISNLMQSKVVNIHRSIKHVIDTTLDSTCSNTNPYKKDKINDYVFRHSGNIKPAIYEPAYKLVESAGSYPTIKYYNRMGRNQFWHKMIFKNSELADTDNFNKYAYREVPPRYPSLKFDSVINTSWEGNPSGVLIYEIPCPIYKGLRFDGTDPNEPYTQTIEKVNTLGVIQKDILTGETLYEDVELPNYPDRYVQWPEYKWFDKSVIRCYPKSYEFTIVVQENDKEWIEAKVWQKFIDLAKFNSVANNITFLKKIYKIEYDLLTSIKKEEYTGSDSYYFEQYDPKVSHLLFEYKIKITLL